MRVLSEFSQGSLRLRIHPTKTLSTYYRDNRYNRHKSTPFPFQRQRRQFHRRVEFGGGLNFNLSLSLIILSASLLYIPYIVYITQKQTKIRKTRTKTAFG
jgi:hypothetical protein